MLVVALYLAAVVAANLIVTIWGPSVSVLTAFALIGLNITARDRLHDAWEGRGLRWKMAALIAAGGALSWLLNRDAGRIAAVAVTRWVWPDVPPLGIITFVDEQAVRHKRDAGRCYKKAGFTKLPVRTKTEGFWSTR